MPAILSIVHPSKTRFFNDYTLFVLRLQPLSFFFFFNDTATTEIYTLSLHDALPIYRGRDRPRLSRPLQSCPGFCTAPASRAWIGDDYRSEEHTSELQSRPHLVCRLLLEKKKKK